MTASSLSPLRPFLPLLLVALLAACGTSGAPTTVQQSLLAEGERAEARGDNDAAARTYRRLADSGIAEAQFRLAAMLLEGRGLARDPERAKGLLDEASATGHPGALRLLGNLYEDGTAVERDPERAAALYEQAVAGGDLDARFYLGRLHLRGGPGFPADPAKGFAMLREAAARGSFDAQLEIAESYRRGRGVRADQLEATRWYGIAENRLRELAEDGDPIAQHYLGQLHLDGLGKPQDVEEALYWMNRAAEGGRVGTMVDLAKLYEEGAPGIEPDPEMALRYRLMAAEHGDAVSAYEAGKRYYDGDGVPRQPYRAQQMFERAAGLGESRAYTYLGELYSDPALDLLDPETAEIWYARGGEEGDGKALFRIAEMHEKGEIEEQDMALAAALYELAPEFGYDRGPERAERVRSSLSAEQHERADRLVAEWRARARQG